jgi:hypothetical protein
VKYAGEYEGRDRSVWRCEWLTSGPTIRPRDLGASLCGDPKVNRDGPCLKRARFQAGGVHCRRVFASDARWTFVRGSELEVAYPFKLASSVRAPL